MGLFLTPSSLVHTDPWFRAAPTAIANPGHEPSSTARNRFNDGAGTFALLYFAPDPVTALLFPAWGRKTCARRDSG